METFGTPCAVFWVVVVNSSSSRFLHYILSEPTCGNECMHLWLNHTHIKWYEVTCSGINSFHFFFMYLQLRQNTMHCARWLLRFLWIRCELGHSVLCRMELFLGCGAVQALRMRSERALWRAEHGVLPTLSLSSVPWTPWDPWSELRLLSSSPSLYLNRSLIWGIKSFVFFSPPRI